MLLLLLFGILKENSRYCKAFVNENKHPESHSFGVFIATDIKNIVASYILHRTVFATHIYAHRRNILYDFSSDPDSQHRM